MMPTCATTGPNGGPATSDEVRADRPNGDDPSTWPTGRLLSTAARLVENRWNEGLAGWGLTHAGFGVIAHLMAGPMSQHQLAGLTMVEDQTISRTLDRLERQGHIVRTQDSSDRRRRVVSLTPSGREALVGVAASQLHLQLVDQRIAEHCDVDAFRAALVALTETEPTEASGPNGPNGQEVPR
jgi:DNA-binding MarR family transcriptional regulator